MSTEEETNYEDIAKQDGWTPKESWKGDPDRWVDAKTFVERGATILPIVQAKLRKKFEEVDELKRKMEEREGVFSEFQKFQDQVLTKAKQEKEDLIKQLEEQRAKAITDGDGQTFTQTDRKLQELRAQPEQKKREEVSPETQAWLTENTWYTTDRKLKAIADGLSDELARENPSLMGRAFLDRLTELVKAEVPHKFQNPRRQEEITTDAGRKGSGGKGRAFDDLPAEAKAAYERFSRTIPGYTKEKYLSQYVWE